MNMSMGVFIATHCQGEVGTGVENTVAPSHDYEAPLTPIIDTQITGVAGEWTGNPTITHQWQKALTDAGPWSDVSGATSINYTPLTADNVFGYVLRRREIPNGDAGAAVAGAATGRVAEDLTGAQSSGANIVTNGDFASGLTGWSTLGTPTTLEETGGRAHIVTDATNEGTRRAITAVTGTFYQMAIEGEVIADGLEAVASNIGSLSSLAMTGVLNFANISRASSTSGFATLRGRTASSEIYADNWTIVPLTLNAQLTAPSADMDMAVLYPLPVSPRIGEQVRLLARISDFSTGNYWSARLEYTGSAWNAVLNSVATNTAAARITATGVGATDGIRITATGDDWELFTTADGGDNWTSRGTFSSSLYNTATGVNAMWTDQFAPETLTPNP